MNEEQLKKKCQKCNDTGIICDPDDCDNLIFCVCEKGKSEYINSRPNRKR